MKTETAELITFGNLNRVPVDEITPSSAIQAADAAYHQIRTLESGNEGREWPCIKARIEREKAELAAFVARFDSVVARKYAKDGVDEDDMPKF